MLKKYIGFQVGFFILFMISADLRSVSADGLPPEEALPTEKTEEAEVLPTPPPEEIAEPEPISENEAPLPKPLSAPPSLKKETREIAPLIPVAARPSETDLWTSFFHGTILSEPKPGGKIVGSKDKKMLLGEGDTIYMVSSNNELIPGKEWVVYKTIKNVYHPRTGQYLGDLIDITGMVKIMEVDKKMATAQIIRSKEPIYQNDQIALVETLFDLSNPSPRSLPEEMTATIVEAKENRMNNAMHDIVYIDRGKKDGIVRGDRFAVIGGGQQAGIHSDGQALRFPEREVGSIIILSAQDHTATGQIAQSSEPISKGSPLLFHFLK